jgi:hypothetical protein
MASDDEIAKTGSNPNTKNEGAFAMAAAMIAAAQRTEFVIHICVFIRSLHPDNRRV